MKWEYNVDPLPIGDKQRANRILNDAASFGWEVVSTTPLPFKGEPNEIAWVMVLYRRPAKSN